MAIYDLSKPKQFSQFVKDVEYHKEAHPLVELRRYHPIATDKQKAYLNFIITYYSNRVGQTFFQTLSEIQQGVAPHIFETGEYDKQGYPRYKKLGLLNTAEASSVIRNFLDFAMSREIMIPDMDDKPAVDYCKRQLESADGWV